MLLRCYQLIMKKIKINKSIYNTNDQIAKKLKEYFTQTSTYVVNLLASPGAGKTSLLESTIEKLGNKVKITVIEGDPYTSIDSERIKAKDILSVQINTKSGCHLEGNMIQKALDELDCNDVDLLFIENVGNLLCPAPWDLGEDIKVVIASLPEGDDKPLKYPEIFLASDVLIVNKIDLEGFIDSSSDTLIKNAKSIKPYLDIFPLSCRSGKGIDNWTNWLESKINVTSD